MPQAGTWGVPWGVGGPKTFFPKFNQIWCDSDLFTILGLWVLGLAVPNTNINESQLQTYESKTLFLMTSLL